MGEYGLIADRAWSLYSLGQQCSRTQTVRCGRRQVRSLTVYGQRMMGEAEPCIISPRLLRLHPHIHTGGRAYLEARIQHTGHTVLPRQVSGDGQRAAFNLEHDRLAGNL